MVQEPPVRTGHLFHDLDQKLLELLRSLTPEEWEAQTVARLWKVKDVAAHLLDGSIRALSMQRDGYFGISPSDFTHQGIINWLNQTNAEWVNAAKRMSPQVLIQLLEITGKPTSDFFASLSPFDKAIFNVTWAGENGNLNWIHVAREYTEKWLHQQQIRDAVNKQGIMTREFFYPFIDTLMYGLPQTYANISADNGTNISIKISGEAGGQWFLERKNNKWELGKEGNDPDAEVQLDPDIAWKLFSKSLRPSQIENDVEIKGNQELGTQALYMVSVMA